MLGAGSKGGQGAKISCARQSVMLGQFTILMRGSFDVQKIVTKKHLAKDLRLISQSTYAAKLNEVISNAFIKNVSYSNANNGCIYFMADATYKNKVVGCVVEIDKQ